jgi:adenylate cyclase
MHLSLRAIAALLMLLTGGLGLVVVLADPLALQTLRHQGFDQYQRWQPRVVQAAPVRIIDIDEASLDRIGQWPWPRTRLASLVERLGEQGVAAIGFDVVFAEPDRTSPQRVSGDWPLTPTARAELQRLPDNDAAFAEAIAKQDVVLGFAARSEATADAHADAHADVKSPEPRYRYVWMGEPDAGILNTIGGAVRPLAPLEMAASGVGVLSFVPDADGVVRRVPMVMSLQGQPAPSLSAELLRVAQGTPNYILQRAGGGAPALEALRIGALTVPTTARGEMWIHYTPAQPQRYVPAWRVLNGTADPALLEGHIVVIGSSAPGLLDLRFNPLGQLMPGVETHAQAMEQALTGQHLARPSWAMAAEALLVTAGCVLLVAVGAFVGSLRAATAYLVLVAALLWGGWWAFSTHRVLLDTFTPAIAWTLAYGLASVCRHFRSELQHRWVRQAFSRYVSPNRVAHLMQNPEQLELGGKRQECSFIFTDLAGFTPLMESIDPADAVQLLNRYLEEMISIAFRYQGTLDRIMGDSLAIMFSAPVEQADHAQRALDCAMEMHRFATGYTRQQQARGMAFGHTRFGIHSGEVIVGNFGGKALFDYRALGDPVNTAARLESVNKHLGTWVCVSEATLSACAPRMARPVGRLVLKGKTEALQVFEPLDEVPEGYAPLPLYRSALDALRAGDVAQALERFEHLRRAYPDDPLVNLHGARLLAGERSDLIVLAAK